MWLRAPRPVVSRLTFSTTYATDGVDDGKRATTATTTEMSTTKNMQGAREDNDTKRTTTTLYG